MVRQWIANPRSPDAIEHFLAVHQSRTLSKSEKIDALRLLEMQRQALLMFTSCGWFFEEISRPEGTQILRYAGRALELAGEVAGIQLEMNKQLSRSIFYIINHFITCNSCENLYLS